MSDKDTSILQASTLFTTRTLAFQDLNVLSTIRTITDSVSASNPTDTYEFDISTRSTFWLRLNKLQANADVELFNSKQQRIDLSRQGGTLEESISRTLAPGTYQIKVTRVTGQTSYNLEIAGLNAQSRAGVRAFYRKVYLMPTQPAINWTGSISPVNPGTTSAAFKNAVLRRVNYFRAMSGVPADVIFNTTYNRKAQAAALIMSANNTLTHSPDSSLAAYTTDGGEGAHNSNLALGFNGWTSIDGYMEDYGDFNNFVGHRRWILYPQTQQMGTGDIPATSGHSAANALWVFDDKIWSNRPAVRESQGFVAWPPRGYTPYTTVYSRWSFSYPNADFSNATVTMKKGSQTVSVTKESIANGYGENTLVWRPFNRDSFTSWPKPTADETYTVNVQNVVINGVARNFSYQVTVFDPV